MKLVALVAVVAVVVLVVFVFVIYPQIATPSSAAIRSRSGREVEMRLLGWLIAVVGVALLALLGWALNPMTSTGLPPSIIGGLNTGQTLLVLAAIIGLGLALIALGGRRRWYQS